MKIINYNYGISKFDLLKRHLPLFFKALTLKKLLNVFLFLIDYLFKRTSALSKPFYIKIEPTNVCNLTCPHCGSTTSRRKGFMKMNDFKRHVGIIKDHCLKIVLYGQGESLLHPEISNMVKYAENEKCPVVISSNFERVTEQQILDLFTADLSHLIVCVDGYTEEQYQKYRRGGKLSNVLRNLKKAVEIKKRGHYKTVIEVQTVMFSWIMDDLDDITLLMQEIGVDVHTLRADMYNTESNSNERGGCPVPWGSLYVTWDNRFVPCEFFCYVDKKHDVSVDNGLCWNRGTIKKMRALFSKKQNKENLSDIPCFSCIHFPERDTVFSRTEIENAFYLGGE